MLDAEMVAADDVTSSPQAAAPEEAERPQEHILEIDLSKPMGITFNESLVAESVQDGSQAAEHGVCKGWRACSVGGESLESTDAFVEKIQSLKAEGCPSVRFQF